MWSLYYIIWLSSFKRQNVYQAATMLNNITSWAATPLVFVIRRIIDRHPWTWNEERFAGDYTESSLISRYRKIM